MDDKILITIIVVLVSFIIIFGIYFLLIKIINSKKKKKVDFLFNTDNLVEEESLMNVMDEKRNVEFSASNGNEDRFIMNNQEVKMVTNEALTQEEKINPFGVDLTKRDKDNTPIEIPKVNEQNKFFK